MPQQMTCAFHEDAEPYLEELLAREESAKAASGAELNQPPEHE